MRVGVDLDGCAYDFGASLKQYLITIGYREEHLPDVDRWNGFTEDWKLTTEQFLAYCAEGVDSGIVFIHGKPYPGTLDGINALRERGHTIHIVTARSFGTKSTHNTVDWLQREGIIYNSLTFSEDKTLMNVDVFIEDRIENYIALVEAGFNAALMDQPWNQEIETDNRVYSWTDFVQFVDVLDKEMV